MAYADFVTAMMAFFLLLWLLSTTPQEVKEGLAEYFTPTIGLKDQIGVGTEGGASPSDDGELRSDKSTTAVMEARPQQGVTPELSEQSQMEGTQEAKLFEKAEAEMKKAMESDPNLREFRDNVFVEQTPEGLKLEIRDSEDKPMFDPGSDNISRFGATILEKMAPIIQKVPNHISITGHTDASPLNRGNYSNWELSTDRAQSARRFLTTQGLGDQKTGKITGRAAQDLLDKEQPGSARNRRIEIILLKGSHLELEEDYQAAPRNLITPPRAEDIMKMREERVERQQRLQQKPEEDMAPPEAPAPATVFDAVPLSPVEPGAAPATEEAVPADVMPAPAQDPQLDRIKEKMQQMKQAPVLPVLPPSPPAAEEKPAAGQSKPSSVLDYTPPVGTE